MSLTSYRAAPPRDSQSASRARNGRETGERELGDWRAWRRPTLPPLFEAVPWALRVFTAEFGMGSGAWPLAMATRPGKPLVMRRAREVSGCVRHRPRGVWRCTRAVVRRWWLSAQLGCACRRGATSCTGQRLWIKPIRAISTGQLRGLLPFHLRPIDVVVYHGSRRDLVLRRVSRLDAFSGYPVRT